MFKLLEKITPRQLRDLSDVLGDDRLSRYLWVELLINPGAVEDSRTFAENSKVRSAVEKALTWYKAYRYVFPTPNRALESLAQEQRIEAERVGWREYRENITAFLKGLQCLGLL